MNENLIVEDNTIYEIDPECLKKKRKCQGETGEKGETENTKKRKQVLMYSLFEIKIKKFIKSMNQELMLLSLSGQ